MVETSEGCEVVFKDVTRVIQTKRVQMIVLQHCSFTVEKSKLTVMIGPSGCGKSTIINLIAGYEQPHRGQVLIDDTPAGRPNWDRLVLFQETALFPWLTCYENVMFGCKCHMEMSLDEAHQQAVAMLDRVGLNEFKDKYPMQLSGGMQRRAELARALINKPRIMLMDEPFRGLDAMTRELMQEYYSNLVAETLNTHLFVTSEIDEALYLADKLLILTNKPTRVRMALDIDLPRPRDEEILKSPEYLSYKNQVLDILHEEALQASKDSDLADVDIEKIKK